MKMTLYNKWLEALESGEYKQAKDQLGNEKDGYCCLGVLCKVAGIEFRSYTAGLPVKFASAIGMDEFGRSFKSDAALSMLNDKGYSFTAIAALIRTDPEQFIRELT